jgi:hypothetical protein
MCQRVECGATLAHRKWPLPVVHEDVRLPQLVRGYPQVLDAAVLALVPAQVVVVPLLKCTTRYATQIFEPAIFALLARAARTNEEIMKFENAKVHQKTRNNQSYNKCFRHASI